VVACGGNYIGGEQCPVRLMKVLVKKAVKSVENNVQFVLWKFL